MEGKTIHITIIGLGLIGGSLGLALKKNMPSAVVTGYSRTQSATDRALDIDAVDIGTSTPEEAAMNADIIFVCTPVRAVRDIFRRITPALKRGCIVTDTASTKSEVMKWGSQTLPPQANFIGGHPMAGKETAGIGAADADLFRNCVWCLTPSKKASLSSVRRLLDLLRKLGARPLMVEAAGHDRLVAGISHLPFILSSALVSTTAKSRLWEEMSRLASSGYRDVTRLASGDSRMYTDICLTNRQPIVDWIDDFIRELQRYRGLVAGGDEAIERAFNEAREARERWLKSRQR